MKRTFLAVLLAIGALATYPASAQEFPTGPIRISEFIANPAAEGNDGAFEWVELENTSANDVTLAGWSIGDEKLDDPIPEVTIPAGGFVVIAGRSAEFDPGIVVVRLADGLIGGGLNNGSDVIRLLDETGAIVDRAEYGGGTAIPAAGEGYSLVRKPDGKWRLAVNPSPGAPNLIPGDAEIEQRFPVPVEFRTGEEPTSKVAWFVLAIAGAIGAVGAASLLMRRMKKDPNDAA